MSEPNRLYDDLTMPEAYKRLVQDLVAASDAFADRDRIGESVRPTYQVSDDAVERDVLAKTTRTSQGLERLREFFVEEAERAPASERTAKRTHVLLFRLPFRLLSRLLFRLPSKLGSEGRTPRSQDSTAPRGHADYFPQTAPSRPA
ncbi:hypothetical protein [Yinghuangia sp. YIM S10712]|uniref:hypothetical protein n=1 Tax=Yinghuangia sp. YIM S10712 TaxID=3436930 RepID=UPI003F5358BD